MNDPELTRTLLQRTGQSDADYYTTGDKGRMYEMRIVIYLKGDFIFTSSRIGRSFNRFIFSVMKNPESNVILLSIKYAHRYNT